MACVSLIFASPARAVDGEIVYTGTNTNLIGDDDAAGPIDLGFDFDFYGTIHSQAYVNINGTVNFSYFPFYFNTPLDEIFPTSPAEGLYPFWDDLVTDPADPGYEAHPIYHATIGEAPNRKFIVQWTNMYFFATDIQMGTFQAIMYEGSNVIQFQYRDLLGSGRAFGDSATIGIKKDNTTFITHSFEEESLAQGQAIRFSPDGEGSYTMDTEAEYDPVYLAPEGAPVSPTLVNPADGSTNVTLTPTFEWLPVTEADDYTVLISTNPSFSTTVVNQGGVTGTSYTLPDDLEVDTVYYWRVQANNEIANSLSSTRSFTTGSAPNQAPDLPAEISSATLIGGHTLASLSGASLSGRLSDANGGQELRYRLQISSSADFGSVVVDYRSAFRAQGEFTFEFGENGGTYLVGTADTILDNGTYYLRIRAEDDASASSEWYEDEGGFTLSPEPEPVPETPVVRRHSRRAPLTEYVSVPSPVVSIKESLPTNIPENNFLEEERKLLKPLNPILAGKSKGRILLQVELRGEAWYVNPKNAKRRYMKDGTEAYRIMRELGVGISNRNLFRIQTDPAFAKRYQGLIFIQVQEQGQAFYIDFNGVAHYLKNGESAYELLRQFGLGISNDAIRTLDIE